MSDAELERFLRAIADDDDRSVVEAWNDRLGEPPYLRVVRGEYLGPIKAQHLQRLQLARDREKAVRKLREAIESDDPETIVACSDRYLSLYDGTPPARPDLDEARIERARAHMSYVSDVRAALRLQPPDDEALEKVYSVALDPDRTRLVAFEYVQIDEALARQAAYRQFREARDRDDDQAIVDADVAWLRRSSQLTAADAERIRLAGRRIPLLARFRAAVASDEDGEIVRDYDPALDGRLPPDLQRRLDEARTRLDMPMQVRAAIRAEDDAAIAGAHDPDLVYTRAPFDERELARIELARARVAAYARFRHECEADDDEGVLEAAGPLAESSLLTREDRARVELAAQRAEALEQLAGAIRDGHDERIAAVGNGRLLRNDCRVTKAQRDRIDLAVDRTDAMERLRKAIRDEDEPAIKAAGGEAALRDHPGLTESQRERIELAIRRVVAFERLLRAVRADRDEEIVAAGKSPVMRGHPMLTAEHWALIEKADRRLRALAEIKAAIRSNDNDAIASAYHRHRGIVEDWSRFARHRPTCERAARVAAAVGALRSALDSGDFRLIRRAYDEHARLLDGRSEFDRATREQIAEAHSLAAALDRFVAATRTGDHAEVLAAYDGRLDGRKEVPAGARRRLTRARRWFAAPGRIADAIRNGDDREILKEADAPTADVARLPSAMREEIERARKRIAAHAELVVEISRGSDEAVLDAYVPRLHGARVVTPDEHHRIALAAERLLGSTDAEPTHLRAWIDGTDLVAHWRRPSNRFVDAVLLCWRRDRPPRSPHDGVGSRLVHVPLDHLRLPVGKVDELHVRAFAMRKDPEAFSPGRQLTASATARPLCHIACTLSSGPPMLGLRSEEGSPLPDLVVALRYDRPPVGPNDADRAIILPGSVSPATSVHLDRAGARGLTYVRVFTHREADRGWAHISHSGVRPLPGRWGEPLPEWELSR